MKPALRYADILATLRELNASITKPLWLFGGVAVDFLAGGGHAHMAILISIRLPSIARISRRNFAESVIELRIRVGLRSGSRKVAVEDWRSYFSNGALTARPSYTFATETPWVCPDIIPPRRIISIQPEPPCLTA